MSIQEVGEDTSATGRVLRPRLIRPRRSVPLPTEPPDSPDTATDDTPDDVDETADGSGDAESDEDDGSDLFTKLRSDRE